jgi:lysozyme
MVTKELIERVKKHEGFRSKPYKCSAGKLTIGYGRNLEDVGISKTEAEFLLKNDLYRAASQLGRLNINMYQLNRARKNVLIEMIFNLGLYGVLGFKRMLAALREKDYLKASKEMLDSKWAKQVGYRAKKLASIMALGK